MRPLLSHEMRFAPEVGRPYALNAGATGKVMLAFDDELAQAVLAAGDLPAYTPNTVVSAQPLAVQLEAMRREGYAASEGERVAGGCAIASPVFGPTGAVMGALTISAVSARCDLQRLVRFAPQLRRGAEEVSARLLGPPQPLLPPREDDAP